MSHEPLRSPHQFGQRIRLIATDIDGTLLDSADQVPAANLRALREALERGVSLVLATARKQASAFAIADLISLPCAVVAHNGARGWDWNGQEFRHLVIDLDLAREIVEVAAQHELPLVLTINEVNYYSATYPLDEQWLGPTERRVQSLLEVLHAPPTRIIAAGRSGVELLCGRFGSAPDSVVVHRYYSREGAIASAVLTHPRATKEDALAELCCRIDVQPHEVLALGDAEADAGLLSWAGVGVAMGNAMPEAQAVADWIAPTHDEAGFAVAVDRFVLQRKTNHAEY